MNAPADNEPRCDCGHLFEICNSPNCPNGDEYKIIASEARQAASVSQPEVRSGDALALADKLAAAPLDQMHAEWPTVVPIRLSETERELAVNILRRAAQEAGGCGANALEKAMTDCQIFSRTSSKSHQLVLEFTTLEGMQHARDIIIKASVPEVREFAQSGSTSKVIEACAKIAEPWSGFWLDKNSTDADRAVVEVRKEIAAKIRALAPSLEQEK